ncbi:MAG: AbrB/MazE/SpoVT family DNA-binding domain-containing protein [Oscillatoria sp. SIO1A7]|nr:AbrB/MazE/SpoVT family DNA-binding domain-containing protein [Oscillatoria sp. SIO1A7]
MTQTSPPRQIQQYPIYLDEVGRLTLPAEVLQRLSLQKGDRLILKMEEDSSLRLVSLREQASKLRGILKDKAPERSLVDELIRERRQEALHE